MLKIARASHEDLESLLPLFDAYRVFYKQVSDFTSAKTFLTNRLNNNETTIFIAIKDNIAVGFVQLYTTFSSVSLEPFFILNDLFVVNKYRGNGIGKELLKKAKDHCIELNYKGLALETAKDNPAQKLYEKLEWKKDIDYLHYFWNSPKNE